MSVRVWKLRLECLFTQENRRSIRARFVGIDDDGIRFYRHVAVHLTAPISVGEENATFDLCHFGLVSRQDECFVQPALRSDVCFSKMAEWLARAPPRLSQSSDIQTPHCP